MQVLSVIDRSIMRKSAKITAKKRSRDSIRLDKLQKLCVVHDGFINPSYGNVLLVLKSETFDRRSEPPTIRQIIDAMP